MRPSTRVAATVLSGSLALTLVGIPLGLPAPAGAAPVETSERFVRRVSFDLLNDADPSAAEVDALLADLGEVGLGQWLADLQRTDAGLGATVDDVFDALLRRLPDEASRTFFIDRLERTGRQKVAADLVASAEYFNGRGGGTNEGWVDALYLDTLGRAADEAGKAYFVGELANGRSRGSIASFFTGGGEGRTVLVRKLYVELLRRTGDAGGVQYYAGLLARGSRAERIIGMMTGSAEYGTKARADLGDEAVVILTAGNQLVFSSTGDVAEVDHTVPVLGLGEGAALVGIDVRPSNGVLYGVTAGGQVVTIDPGSGFATPLGAPIPGFAPSGGVGFDFNPMADALRIVTGTQNYRVNATTGALANMGGPDTPLTYTAGDRNAGVTPDASGAAYTNSTRGLPLPTATALFDIDEATNSVVQQVPANDGTLVTKGRLHLDATAVNGFDVSPTGAAFAVLDAPEAGPSLWRIDTATGEPRLVSTDAPADAVGFAVLGTQAVVPDTTFVGATGGLAPTLVTFASDGDPAPTSKLIVGLDLGTEVVGLDIRPKTGVLHALGSNGQIYTVDASGLTANVTKLGTPIAGFVAADGTGFDFNPMADALRITNGTRNYRVRLADGVVVGEGVEAGTAGALTYATGDTNQGATPAVTGAAYLNSQRSETQPGATALFDIDEDLDVVVRQNPANAGTLLTIGALGVDATAVAGFDVAPGIGQTTFAVLTVGGADGLYRVDLGTGAATLVGTVPGGLTAVAVG